MTRTEYDELSRPVTVTLNYRPELPPSADTNIQTLTYYDGAGNVIWQRDALGRWTKTDYDALGRPTTVTANYDDGNPLTEPSDADIISVTHYDQAGRVDHTIDNWVDGAFSTTEPITDRVTLMHYDTLGRTTGTSVNHALGIASPELNRTSITAYDPSTGRVSGQRDALHRWVSQQYDALGRASTSILNCTGPQAPYACGTPSTDQNVATHTRYDALGRAFETVDPLGVVTHTEFDGLGRAIATTRNFIQDGPTSAITNVTTLTAYDAAGRVTATTDALGQTSTTQYNALDQTIRVTDTLNRVTEMGYDGSGALRWVKRPDGQLTVYTLDGLGRTVATIVNYHDGSVGSDDAADQDLVARTEYDAGGRRTQTTDPAGRVTAFAYDNLDRLIAVTENATSGECAEPPCNVITRYAYDRAGNRTAIIDANGHTRGFQYDAANQQTQATDALGHTTSWEYDAGGRVKKQDDPRGSSYDVTYHYSAMDQITETLGLAVPIGAQYDALGRRTQLSDGTGVTSFAYDPLGRITSVQAPDTGTLGYDYDTNGRRSGLTYPDGSALAYDYWPDGQLRSVTQGSEPLASYTYDLAGRLDTLARANGASTTYGYDAADRLRSLHTSSADGELAGFAYGVNRVGLRTVVTETLALATPTEQPVAARRVSARAADVQSASVATPATAPCTNATAAVTVGAGSYDDAASQIRWSGTWEPLANLPRAAFGTISRTSNGSATLTFQGSRISYMYTMGPDRGTTVVCLDGQPLSSFSASAAQYRRGVVRTWEVAPGTHTFQVVAQGGGFTDLDLLAVDIGYRTVGTYDDTDPLAYYTDSTTWTPDSGIVGATNGTLHYTDSAEDFVRFTFRGTLVRYVYSTGPTRAKAVITIDGVTHATLDLYSATYERQHRWQPSALLPLGTHSLHIQLLGVDAIRTRLDVDGLVVSSVVPTTVPTKTPTATATRTPTPTATRTATPTATRTATATPAPPSATGTAEPTATPIPPTATGTAEPSATSTSTSTATPIDTSTATPIGTAEPSATATGTAEPTTTGTATLTSTTEPTASATSTAEPSATSTTTPTDTAEPTVTSTAEPTATVSPAPLTSTRVVTYAYDGLQRLTSAVESPGASYRYAYDLAGNRTDVWTNGTLAAHQDYNAANQVQGWAYDNAGNLMSDDTTTYSYDALGRMTTRGATTYSYNGDGVLVDDGTTRYTQDLASPLSQVLQTTQDGATANHLYGLDRLASVADSTRSWYNYDALGSVRQTISDAGTVLGTINYDPWGGVESGTVPTFGFTGELQDAAAGMVNLRARWYSTASGAFTSRDSFAGFAEQPYSLHPYQYGYSVPTVWTDPSGRCPAPAASKGHIICIDLFIQSQYIILWSGYGDGRGFDWNSPPDKSRGYLYIYLDSSGKMVGTETHINPSCTIFGCFGPYPKYNHFDANQDPSTGDVKVSWELLNGLSGALRENAERMDDATNAPHLGDGGATACGGTVSRAMSNAIPEINGELTLHRDKTGTYKITSLDRDPYPSLEVYYYVPRRPVQVIMQHGEHWGGPMVGLNPIVTDDTDITPYKP